MELLKTVFLTFLPRKINLKQNIMKEIKYEISLLGLSEETLTGVNIRIAELKEKIINRLKEQYKSVKEAEKIKWHYTKRMREYDYDGMKLICLDCNLLTLKEIKQIELDIDLYNKNN